MKFIAKLHPEISIKSRSVRQRFTKILESNIKNVLRRRDPKAWVQKQWDCIDVRVSEGLENEAIELLKCVPGVHGFSKVLQSDFVSFEKTFEIVHQLYASKLENKTFSVRVKRRGKHDFTSKDVEQYVGGGLNQTIASAKVDLKKPELEIKLEIANDQLFIISDQFKGLGGFPIATQDEVLSLISGGFDSGVASYLTMRRGIKTHFVFFNLGGSAHEVGVQQVAYYLWDKFGASHRVKFVSVDFQPVVAEILENIDSGLMGVVLKRMMLRAAEKVAKRLRISGLVTGEALGQVSSQTLANLALIDKVTDHLVVRPLVAMDKQDIIDIARQIGTEDFARTMPEYCGVISQRPNIAAPEDKVLANEAQFYMQMIDDVVEQAKLYDIKELAQAGRDQLEEVESLDAVGPNQVIIDVRSSEEEEQSPLEIASAEVIHIPFFKLSTRFGELDPAKEYLLYCEKGVMSKLQALHLKEQGHVNVKLFQPVK
ncbi:tRNA uracil 4-sulfurtransferase ThiI [Gayadomonas joobiniege]|uniref:tRNA uracil 4-sulfurtransferase ThiI n=1 Tax=Gayadomonas joobiniege TaxID=1234606 RepID=UPI0004751BEB|nr:tRNA uracil 4-sulfurtransferase ThiI [Gayadomonas joobiniege]